MEEEIWKDIAGYEGHYQASNFGRIRSLDRIIKCNGRNDFKSKGKILKLGTHKRGYKTIMLHKDNNVKLMLVHRIIAECFLPDKSNFKSMPDEDRSLVNLDELQINHKDENKENNCVENLEWCTNSYNAHYGTRIQRCKKNNNQNVLVNQYDDKGNCIKVWNSIGEVERTLNIYNVSSVCRKKYKQTKGYYFGYHNYIEKK